MSKKKIDINKELEESDKIPKKKLTGKALIKQKIVEAVRKGDLDMVNRYKNQLKGSK